MCSFVKVTIILWCFQLYSCSLEDLKRRYTLEATSQRDQLCDSYKRVHGTNLRSALYCLELSKRYLALTEYIATNNKNESSVIALRLYPDSLLSPKEFTEQKTGYMKASVNEKIAFNRRTMVKRVAEEYLNYADLGCVTPVQDQKKCGACYSFTAMAVLESAILRKSGTTNDFSEQQCLDCTYGEFEGMNYGCSGGHPFYVIRHAQVHEIVSEGNYTYSGKLSPKCMIEEKKQDLNFDAGVVSYDGSDEGLMEILRDLGPVSVAVAVGDSCVTKEFKHYGGGIISKCGTALDHAVLLVGYRKSAEGSYWIVKNSWGADWGEKGFANIQMGTCSITEDEPVAVVFK